MAGALKTEALIVIGVGLGVLFLAKTAADKAGKMVDNLKTDLSDLWDYSVDKTKYVNPVSDQNLAYQGASAFARWLSGGSGDLGSIVWDYVNKAEPAPGGGLTNYTPAQQAADLKATQQLEAGFHGM